MWPLLVALAVAAPPPEQAPEATREPGAASAPAPEPAPASEPERTQVRRQRFDPPPTAVLDRDRLAETAGGDLAAALDSEPGLAVNRLGGLGAFTTLSIRGSTPEQVLVVLDGIPLNPADGAPVDLSTLPVGPLDAVHVYRGRTPWSLGLTGLGGALVLTTRDARALDAAADLVAGAYTTTAARAFVTWPIARTPVGVTLALDGLHSDGDFRFVNDGGTAWTTTDDAVDTRANAAVDQASVLARADVALDGVRVTLVDLTTRVARGLPSLGVTPTRASRFTLVRHLVALRLDARLGAAAQLGVHAFYADTSSEVDDPRGEIGLGRDRARVTSEVPGVAASLHVPLALSATARLVPSLHLSWRHEATRGTTLASDARDVLAGGAELWARFASGLQLGGGARLESDLAATPATAFAVFVEASLALTDVRLTAGARLAPRLPSLFELHGDTGLALGNPALAPEHATTVELGARWEPRLGAASDDDAPDASTRPLALALFVYATWADDLIQFIQNAQGVSRPENLASARILGAELALEGALAPFHLRSSCSVMNAIDTSDIAARAGNHLPLRPSLATSHRLELRLGDATLGPAPAAVGLYLELDHVAGNHLDFANLVALPARTLLGAGAFVRSDRADVTLSLANLLSDRVQDLAGYPLPGLTTMLSLRLHPSAAP